MNRVINYSWQALYRAEESLLGRLSSSPVIEFQEPETYFNRVSAKEPTLYHPIDLRFTNLFHIYLQKAITSKIGKPIRNKNFPYELWINSFESECRIGLSVQLFLPDLMSVRLVCYNKFRFEEGSAFKNRLLQNHPVLLFIAESAVKIGSEILCAGMPFRRSQTRPVLGMHYDTFDDNCFEKDQGLLVALLINDEGYRKSNAVISQSVIAANLEHNRKGEKSKLILLNKQGYLYVTNNHSQDNGLAAQEIKKRERMFELACVLQKFYETYPSIRRNYTREMDYLFFATQGYVERPELTFSSSFGNTLAWMALLDSLKLREAFNYAKRFDVDSKSRLAGLFDRIPHPHYADPKFWDIVRQTLGEDYMAKSAGGPTINFRDNYGAIATGDNSVASATNFGREQKTEALSIIEQLAQLRGAVPEGDQRERFDEVVVSLRSEVKADKPDSGKLRKAFGTLTSILGPVASAASLLASVGKLLGII
jgi:hypothetical protein